MKLLGRIGISGASVSLPEPVESVSSAVAAGRLNSLDAESSGVRSVHVSPGCSGPDLAANAGRAALAASGVDPDSLSLLAHAWVHYQGHDFWSPAHYVCDQLGAGHALPVGLQAMCNGGALGLLLAVRHVLTEEGDSAALVTTGDRFAEAGFDRWASDYAVAYGDGGTAAVVRRSRPYRDDLRLHALTAVSAPELERMYRGDDPFGDAPRLLSDRVDVRRAKRAYLAAGGMEQFKVVAQQKVTELIAGVLQDAGIDRRDARLTTAILPRLGPSTLELVYCPAFEDFRTRPVVLGERTGHLGAGDFLANLADVRAAGAQAGDFALVVGGGGGFSWTAAVVEVMEEPS